MKFFDGVLLTVLCASMIVLVGSIVYCEKHTSYRVAIGEEMVVCQRMQTERCGVRFIECDNNQRYECMHDIAVEEIFQP